MVIINNHVIFFSTTYAFNVSVVNIYERIENIFYSVSLIVLSIYLLFRNLYYLYKETSLNLVLITGYYFI